MADEMKRLAGKTCIITGGGRGLGYAAALEFASQGASVVIADLNVESDERIVKDIEAFGGQALSIDVDVSDSNKVDQMVHRSLEAFGSIDILLHCAGIGRLPSQRGADGWRPMQELSENDWDKIVAVNLKGTFLTNQRVGAHMIKNGHGSIVNVASMSGVVANKGMLGHGAYCASKAGVISLTQVLATEWATFNVRVNAISPAYMNTEMMSMSRSMPGVYESHIDMTPMRRYGEPSEFAKAVLFLASDDSSFVTGHNLLMDGGYTAW